MPEEPYRVPAQPTDPQAWERQRRRLEDLRRRRDRGRLEAALEGLRRAAEGGESIMPAMIQAAKAYATPGDVGRVFRQVFSTWSAPLPL
jgi:methylmalonyl-CoA mutase N-terminal domain/subunit